MHSRPKTPRGPRDRIKVQGVRETRGAGEMRKEKGERSERREVSGEREERSERGRECVRFLWVSKQGSERGVPR